MSGTKFGVAQHAGGVCRESSLGPFVWHHSLESCHVRVDLRQHVLPCLFGKSCVLGEKLWGWLFSIESDARHVHLSDLIDNPPVCAIKKRVHAILRLVLAPSCAGLKIGETVR